VRAFLSEEKNWDEFKKTRLHHSVSLDTISGLCNLAEFEPTKNKKVNSSINISKIK
jgi:hypothetical protein